MMSHDSDYDEYEESLRTVLDDLYRQVTRGYMRRGLWNPPVGSTGEWTRKVVQYVLETSAEFPNDPQFVTWTVARDLWIYFCKLRASSNSKTFADPRQTGLRIPTRSPDGMTPGSGAQSMSAVKESRRRGKEQVNRIPTFVELSSSLTSLLRAELAPATTQARLSLRQDRPQADVIRNRWESLQQLPRQLSMLMK
jgi:hypothetical protein